jgi:putative peptidoglycan lipid II flippase
MAFLLVPLFSRALAEGGGGPAGPAMRDLVSATVGPVVAILTAASATVLFGAPLIVRGLAPGLADPGLAIACTRLTAITVLTFGLAGYVSAALRAHHVFGPPAAIHLAYNVGILALVWTLHDRLGIVAAAAGVALGSLFMVLVQVASFLRCVGLPHRPRWRGSTLMVGAFAPVAVYTLTRHAQVFVERYLGSHLPPGSISQLNYAQKVAQLPVLVALLVSTVTFPTLARTVADGRTAEARLRLESDLRTATAVVALATAYLVAFAPVVVAVLLEHGRFDAADTAATAAILRVYALGLLGQAMVGVLCRPFFTGGRPGWYPAAAMAAGLAVTAVLAVASVPHLGVAGIAAANGAGITVTAVLLLAGLRRRSVAIALSTVAPALARIGVSAAAAGALGWLAGAAMTGLASTVVAVVGGLVVLFAFVGMAHLTGATEVTELTSGLMRRIRRVH